MKQVWLCRFVIVLAVASIYRSEVVPPASAETFDCVINPSQKLRIGSPVSTTLQSVAVDRGDKIVAGQILARLESAVEQADVDLNAARAGSTADIASHAARLDFARLEATRAESLLKDNNGPRQKAEETRSALLVAQADMQIAILNHHVAELELMRSKTLLEQRIIRSPMDGVVSQRLLGPGEFVHQDAQIVELAAIDPLYIETYPPTRYYGTIRLGDTAMVTAELPNSVPRKASVIIVDQILDAGSGTFGVRLSLPNTDGMLPAGIRCHVEIAVRRAPTVPGQGE